MVVTLEEIEHHLRKIDKMTSKIPSHIKRLEKQIQLCHLETQDLLHKIEMSNFNAHEGWKLAKDLQLTRQARRKAKDELDGLNKLLENRVKKHSPLEHHVAGTSKILEDHNSKLANRRYLLRVRKDLSENGKFIQ